MTLTFIFCAIIIDIKKSRTASEEGGLTLWVERVKKVGKEKGSQGDDPANGIFCRVNKHTNQERAFKEKE